MSEVGQEIERFIIVARSTQRHIVSIVAYAAEGIEEEEERIGTDIVPRRR